MSITVIGAGHMGGALIELLALKQKVIICDRNEERAKALAKRTNSLFVKNPQEAIKGSQLIILAVKPKDIKSLANAISCILEPSQVLISILAGTTLASLQEFFPHTKEIIRMMPNLAITLGKGIVGFSSKSCLDQKQMQELFSSLGLLIWLEEGKMEAFSSLAASSPAFILVLMEAMVEAGISLGFSSQEAKEIVCQVVEGAAVLAAKKKETLQELKWQITSPGGTTIAGLKALEVGGFKEAIWNAIEKTYEKAVQIAHKD